jgi:hypothetical protein
MIGYEGDYGYVLWVQFRRTEGYSSWDGFHEVPKNFVDNVKMTVAISVMAVQREFM